MFKNRITLFRLSGFKVNLDLSWIIIAVLVVWSLSVQVFPDAFMGLHSYNYWMMGIVGALGLFISIIIHEFSHSLMARKYGIPMKGITLFIFGGVAEMGNEPSTAKAEFMMAVMGPITSALIGLALYSTYFLFVYVQWPVYVNGVIEYISIINFILAVFNLLPAFPLDGGRILRSFLWWLKDDLIWATHISTRIGSGFGILLIIFGLYSMFSDNIIGGLWQILIGMFLKNAAQRYHQQLLMKIAQQQYGSLLNKPHNGDVS